MVYQKNYEDSVGALKNQSGSAADGWDDERTEDHSEKKTIWVSGACIEGRWPERDSLLGMIERKRARGRQKMMYMDGIKEMVGKRR